MKNNINKTISILMAEDDPEDRMLAQEAFRESRLVNDFRYYKTRHFRRPCESDESAWKILV